MTKIDLIEAMILDIPTIRGHVLSMATMRTQSAVLVKVKFSDGSEGIGEGTTIGGLSYGAESPEGIKSAIDTYEVLSHEGSEIKLRFNWQTLSYRYSKTDQHWGTSFYTIDTSGPKPLITDKKVVLKNDHIHHVIDIYHI